MGTYSTYSSSKKKDYSSSPSRQAERTQRVGGARAGRMESRMQLMRKHRAARRSQRKEAGIFGKSEAAKQKTLQRGEQRQERRSMYRKHSAVGRSYASSRRSTPRPTLRERASSARSGYQRAGGGTATGISRADQMRQILGDPNRPGRRYGGEQQSSRRRRQMRRVLSDY